LKRNSTTFRRFATSRKIPLGEFQPDYAAEDEVDASTDPILVDDHGRVATVEVADLGASQIGCRVERLSSENPSHASISFGWSVNIRRISPTVARLSEIAGSARSKRSRNEPFHPFEVTGIPHNA